jgi:hypothetical protein
MDRCAQCLTTLEDDLGYEMASGRALCGPCYFRLWGPRGADPLARSTERRRPDSRRGPSGSTVWIPGPTGELDRSTLIRRARRWR